MSTFGYILGVQSAMRDLGLLKYASDEEAMEFAGSVDSMMPGEMASPEELLAVGDHITEADLAGLIKIVNVLLELKAHHDETIGQAMGGEQLAAQPQFEGMPPEASEMPAEEPTSEEPPQEAPAEESSDEEAEESEEEKKANVASAALTGLKTLARTVKKNPGSTLSVLGATSAGLGAAGSKMPPMSAGL